MPYSTFTRWWRRFHADGARALQDRSKRPKRSPRALPGGVLDVIRTAQHALGVGAKRLHATLRAAAHIQCSASSVYRVLKRAGALTLRPPKPHLVWKRYAKETPGERAQMDLKYLAHNRYHCTLIDDCSRSLAATVLTGRTMADVVAALPALLSRLPAPLQCLQTDNGSEFQSAFTAALAARGIRHARTRPRTPGSMAKLSASSVPAPKRSGMASPALTSPSGRPSCRPTSTYFYTTQRLHSALGYTTPAIFARARLTNPPAAHLSCGTPGGRATRRGRRAAANGYGRRAGTVQPLNRAARPTVHGSTARGRGDLKLALSGATGDTDAVLTRGTGRAVSSWRLPAGKPEQRHAVRLQLHG